VGRQGGMPSCSFPSGPKTTPLPFLAFPKLSQLPRQISDRIEQSSMLLSYSYGHEVTMKHVAMCDQ